MGTPPAKTQTRPTEAELSAVWEALSAKRANRFAPKTISDTVESLVRSGKIRPQAAPAVKSYAVYAEDLIRDRAQQVNPVRAARGLEERYFLGGQSEAETSAERELLRTARTSMRPEQKPTRRAVSLGIPESEEQLIRRSLQTPEGKKLALSTIQYQRKREGRGVGKNPLDRLRPRAEPTPKREEPKGVSKRGGRDLAMRLLRAVRGGKPTEKDVYERKPGDKRAPQPKYYGPETLEKALGPEGSDVFAGVNKDPTSAFDYLNERAKAGDVRAAMALRVLRRKMYKTGERARKAQQTVTGTVMKPTAGGGFEPVIDRATGKPKMRTETPAEQARRRARNESKYVLGLTPREEAERAARRARGGRTRARQGTTVEEAIVKRAEQEVRNRISGGLAGPLQREAAEYVARKGREALESADPELLEDLKRLSRIRTVKPEPSPEVVLARLRGRDEPSITVREQRAFDRARGRKTRFGALERIDRLSRIMRSRGKGR